MADSTDVWEHQRVLQYITANDFKRVTLQFPDDLLCHAHSIARELQQLLQQHGLPTKVYVLADTSYNPLSIDEVAAAHVKADCVVHYGYASLHPVSRTPALCVLPKRDLNVQQTSTWLVQQLAQLHEQVQATCSKDSNQQGSQQPPVCIICSDQGYIHQLEQLQQAVQAAYSGPLQLAFAQSAPTELWPQKGTAGGAASHAQAAAGSCVSGDSCCIKGTPNETQPSSSSSSPSGPAAAPEQCSQSSAAVPIGGLVWQLPSDSSDSTQHSSNSGGAGHMVWLGPPASPALTHLQLSFASRPWLMLDPDTQAVAAGLSPGLDRLLKRRYYLVERARGASMVGLLVGTLGAAGYKTALEQLRHLAAEAGKKTYTLLMGKPNPAKLANFPEIEVFVMLADPQGLILDSKEYLNPIITPHEAFLAFTGKDFDAAHYRLDFGDLLQLQEPAGVARGQGVSTGVAVGGNITEMEGSDEDDEGGAVQQLSSAAGALVIAGGSHSQALTGTSAGKQVQVHSAAQYLTQRRTYKGLETPATGGAILPAAVAVVGRSGRAAAYFDEPQE